MSIGCDKKPETMTPEQLKNCDTCPLLSGAKIWCCKHGFWVRNARKRKLAKVILGPPTKEKIKPPTILTMTKHFTKAMGRWAKKGFKTVDKQEYIKRRQICHECTPSGRCPHCGCMLWAKVALVTEKCPEKKW